MRYLIAVVLSALLITHIHVSPVNNLANARPHGRTVQAIAPEKATAVKSAALTDQKAVAEPEKVAAAVTPTPQPTRFASGCSTYDSIFRQYAWDVTTAEAICQAESSGNPYAVSPTSDYGLMQINHIHSDMVNGDLTALFNPTENIAVAYRIYSAHGWTAWSTYLNGSYRRFI